MSVDIETLVGSHVLSGVEESVVPKTHEWHDDDSRSVGFVLDGKVYAAIEDASDGYRSSMRELLLLGNVKKLEFNNRFRGVRVDIRKTPQQSNYRTDDTYDFVVKSNGLTVLTIGTDNTDDYYPSFVGNYHPENLPVNQKKARRRVISDKKLLDPVQEAC